MTLEQHLQAAADGFSAYLTTAGDPATVSREFRDFSTLKPAELDAGHWMLIATAGGGFDGERDIQQSHADGRHSVALIYYFKVGEKDSPLLIEQRSNAALAHVMGWMQHGSCRLYLSSYNRCRQLAHPHGWLATDLYFKE